MFKVATVVGARPQFVKAAVVSRALRTLCAEVLIHTGQHYDIELSEAFFTDLAIPAPAYNLGVGSHAHGRQTGEMLVRLEELLLAEHPDLVLVYGDTNSTLAGALAAVKLCIPIAHVEAGVRYFSLGMPEEVNRVLTDRISALLFCATQTSVDNLEREGIREGVILSGDVMLDLHLTMREVALARSSILEQLGVTPGRYLLGTIHRPQNTDSRENLAAIAEAFLEMDEVLVLPLHPRTAKTLQQSDLYDRLAHAPHIHLLKPLGYIDFLRLEMDARLIVTDSGGVQKEAYFCRRPCVTVYPTTGWPETVVDGWNRLVKADKQQILAAVSSFRPAGPQRHVFGEGRAAEAVAAAVVEYLQHPRPIYEFRD